MTPYRNIYATLGGAPGGPVLEPEDENGSPIRRPPSGGPKSTPYGPRNGTNPIPDDPHPSAPPPPTVANPPKPPPLPEASDPGFASPAGGPAGVGGTGGYGFANMAQYMYANPTKLGPGSGYAPTPNGMTPGDFNPDMHGYGPNGGYTPGMSAVDNALNQVYGRNSTTAPANGLGDYIPPAPAAPGAPAATPATPAGSPTFTPPPDAPAYDPNAPPAGSGYKGDPGDRKPRPGPGYPNVNKYITGR